MRPSSLWSRSEPATTRAARRAAFHICAVCAALLVLGALTSCVWSQVTPAPASTQPVLTNTDDAGASGSRTATPTITATASPIPSATATIERPTPTTVVPTATSRPTLTPTPVRVLSKEPPTRLWIPSIDLDAPVVEIGWKVVESEGKYHTEWEVADFAVGFHKTSAYPGNRGNTVLSGHHNIRGEVFRDLYLLEPGDEIFLYVGIQGYRYTVAAKYRLEEKNMPPEVRESNARWIQQTPDERLTMVTCWPYSGNSHRIVIVARPAD